MNHNPRMHARLSAFVIWAVVAVATAFWGLRLLVRSAPAPGHTVVVNHSTVAHGDLTRLLGAEPLIEVADVSTSSRFQLIGVMAAKAAPEGNTPGVALISVDGKPARAYVSGARVDDQMYLQTVSPRSATLGAGTGGAMVVLEIPPLPPPATGTLEPAVMEGEGGGTQSTGTGGFEDMQAPEPETITTGRSTQERMREIAR